MEQVFTNWPDREVMTCALLCLEVHGDYIATNKSRELWNGGRKGERRKGSSWNVLVEGERFWEKKTRINERDECLHKGRA